jgi:NAD-dependent dihydropyrimidine dehydrogenase PreA subunit
MTRPQRQGFRKTVAAYLIDIDYDRCEGAGRCAAVCPKAVFAMEAGRPELADAGRCNGCLSCVETCPTGSVSVRVF